MKPWRWHPRMPERLSLHATLLSAFALVIALSLIPVAIVEESEEVAKHALQRIVRVDMRVSDLALHGITTFLDARRHEKDFLLRYREFGFGEARARYVIQVQASIVQLRDQMQQLRELTSEALSLIHI